MFIFIPIILLLMLAVPVFAAKDVQGNVQSSGLGQQTQQQAGVSPSPTGNQVKNQNNIRTQNQGEDTQIQNQIQEGEGSGSGEGLQTRNQNAIQNMSEVAQRVQELLQVRTMGGIGEQVRQIAQAQNQAQAQIQEKLSKLDSRGKIVRILAGTDRAAIESLKAHLEQNQLRIEQLSQLQYKLANQGDMIAVQAAIQSLAQENISLQERISSEEQTKSVFGWLFRLFSK